MTSTSCSIIQYFNGRGCIYNPVYAKANQEESLSLDVGAPSASAAPASTTSAQVLATEKPDCPEGTYWFPIANSCITQT